MKSLLIVICAFALTYGYPENNVNNKIVHGRPAKDGEFPYQVALLENGRLECGGSIIKPNVVLTAAHCLTELYSVDDLKIYAGAINLNDSNAQVRDVLSVKIHELYDKTTSTHDIGIVILAQDFVLSEKVQVVEIENDEVPLYSMVTASGWGLIENEKFPSNLMAVNTTIVDCAGSNDDVPDHVICTDGYHAVCSGDSGGPLVYNGRQLGITSRSGIKLFLCGRRGTHSFYTNVHMFSPWIQENLNM